MKGFFALALGVGFLLLSFAWAVLRTKAISSDNKWSSVTYTASLGASLALSGLLCASAQLERVVSVDSYVHVFDLMSAALLTAVVSGIVVLIKNRTWLPNFLCFLGGAVVTFVEFLGR